MLREVNHVSLVSVLYWNIVYRPKESSIDEVDIELVSFFILGNEEHVFKFKFNSHLVLEDFCDYPVEAEHAFITVNAWYNL